MRRKRNPSPALQPIEPKTRISDGGKDYSRNPFSKYLWPYSQLDSPWHVFDFEVEKSSEASSPYLKNFK